MTMPGVQKPHCRPWHSLKAACMGCRPPSISASPSMVRTSQPSACTASMAQDLTAWPSTMTVQAPHWLVSQPTCRSEEHTSELQSQSNLVCRLLLEKKKKKKHESYA